MSVTTVNPATEEVLARYDFQTNIEEEIQRSTEAFTHWRKVPLETRLQCLRSFSEGLAAARVELGELMSREMGKPIRDSLAEVDKCAMSCKTLIEKFPVWEKETHYASPPNYVIVRNPFGPLLGIMPWNFPLWQVVRFAGPALLCGNTVLLKHAPNTFGSSEFIAELFRRSFPDSTYIDVRIDVDVAAKVIADPRIRGVSLTGSRSAGSKVGALAGEHLKKCVLELGGSDAYVVLDDADIDVAIKMCAQSRLINAGQSCVSAKRFIVTKKNYARFKDGMVAALEAVTYGDPLDLKTELGPLARKDLRDGLHAQVEKSISGGARLLLGGKVPKEKGYYYSPSVLADVQPGQVAFDEELFGPVAAICEARDEEQAIQLANQSRYGLGGAIFSRDTDRALRLAKTEMEAGMVFINDFVRSDASVPFGGVKDSGLGRELGREGCFEFTFAKTLAIKS